MTVYKRFVRLFVLLVLPLVLMACYGSMGSSGDWSKVGQSAYLVKTPHHIHAKSGPNGSISPEYVRAYNDDIVTFTVTPDPGYAIKSISGDASWQCKGTLNGNIFTTEPIRDACGIQVYFYKLLPSVE